MGLKVSRSTANETWAAQNLNKLTKYSKQPLPMRYPAFSWKMDLKMGLLEGFSSFIGYALMLAVNISYISPLNPKKKMLLTVTLFLNLGYAYECLVFYCNHPWHYRW